MLLVIKQLTRNEERRQKRKNSSTIHPVHYGSGDNVGTKNVFQAVSPEALELPIKNILERVRHKKLSSAKSEVSTLKASSSLDGDAIGILNVLAILIELYDDNIPPDAYQQLLTYLNTTTNSLCKDITYSALLRLDIKKDKLNDAIERYKSIENPCVFTREAYYELIEIKQELKDRFVFNKLQLDEIELCGIFRGALRLKEPELASNIAQYLDEISPSLNTKIFMALARASLIELDINQRHYWSITATIRREILDLCNNAVTLLNECNGKDLRAIEHATNLLQFVMGQHTRLADTCRHFITDIESLQPEVATQIRYLYEHQSFRFVDQDNIFYKITRAKEDPLFKRDIVNSIINSRMISLDQSSILSQVADFKSIQKWLDEGGYVQDEDSFSMEFSELELKILICNNDPQSVEGLRLQIDAFTKKYEKSLLLINPVRLIDIANILLDLNIPTTSQELLKQFVPISDPWASPISCSYFNSLLACGKMKTLQDLLSKMDESEWNAIIWQIKGQQLSNLKNYPEAINAFESSLNLDPLSLFGWYKLLNLHKRESSDRALLIDILNRIPDEIFSQPSEIGYSLLVEITINGNFTRAETIILRWFINDPEGCAINFTNFHHSLIHAEYKSFHPSAETPDCLVGYNYSIEKNKYNKLVVKNSSKPHHSLLEITSPLAISLSEMSCDEIKQDGMQELKLIKSFLLILQPII